MQERPISSSRSQSAKATKNTAINSAQKTKSLQPLSNRGAYDSTFHHNSAEESGYNMLDHGMDKGTRSSVMSQPYSSLEHSGGNSSRKTSYSSLQSPGDSTIDEVYEYPPDQDPSNMLMPSRAEQYGRLDHTSRYTPELPQRRKSSQQNEYGTLDHSEELRSYPGVSAQQDQQYGKLDHSSRTPELPQRRTVSQSSEYGKLEHSGHRKTSNTIVESTGLQENEYGKLDHASHTPELPQRRIDFQENEYGKLDHAGHMPELPQRISSQENEYGKLQNSPYETPVGLQQNEYGRFDHDGHVPKLAPQRNVSPQEYELLVHSSQQSNNQDNEYGRLDHTGHTPELPRKGVIVQDGEYGKLKRSFQPDTSSSNQQNNRHSEYHKLQLGTESSAADQSEYSRLDQVNQSGQQQYSQSKPSSQSSAVYQNEPGRWAETQGSSGDQHYSVPRKLHLASNSVPSSAPYQGQISESAGETNYSQLRKVKEFSTPQKDNVPSGYETFKREHGTSVSSAISSYSSDPEDNTDGMQSEVTQSGDGEYSMLSPIVSDGVDKFLVGQSNSASHVKQKTHAKQKPIPKPRHT